MSLFGSYIQESLADSVNAVQENQLVFEGVQGNVDANVTDSMNELAFISGNILTESKNFDEFMGLRESMIPQIFNESISSKLSAIKDRFLAFIEKVQQFFADLNVKLQAKVFSKIAKLNKNGEFKKNVKIYDLAKDKEYEEVSKKIFDALSTLEHADANVSGSDASDIDSVMQTIVGAKDASGDKFLEFDADHFAKYQTEIVKGSKVADGIKILDAGKNVIKTNNDMIKRCKALKSKFEKIAGKSEEGAAAFKFAKSATAILNASTNIARAINTQMLRNAAIIGAASASAKGEKEEPAKLEG